MARIVRRIRYETRRSVNIALILRTLAPGPVLLIVAGLALVSGHVHAAAAAARKPKTAADYHKFAMTHDGDAVKGRLLFHDEQRLACVKCHSVDGRATKAGPDLATLGDQFDRRDLLEAVLSPSATIAVGYGTTRVETKEDEEYQGVLKQVTAEWVELAVGDGNRMRIPTAGIREQRGSTVSLMPEGLQAGVTEQEFTDLIEYLVSLKQADHLASSHQGMPAEISPLARPVGLRPLYRDNLRVMPESGAPELGVVWCEQVPGFTNRFLVLHQAGRIWLVEESGKGAAVSVFADFVPEVFSARGPNGLLGLAFHPKFRENRKYYLKHQVFEQGRITTLLVERQAAADARSDSGRPSRRLLTIPAVAEHHNGGCIRFGPDGFLYFGMGDSAPNFDPQGYAQDLRLLFGKMLRLDVDHRDAGLGYAIPADNPFRGRADARPEIWAYGLREPWRFSFDPLTGDLWVADLGQERGDEVDIVRRGENYGWNVYEGFELFSNQHRRTNAAYAMPLFAGWRKHGVCMVGGHVYRGDNRSSFHGVYVFGDYQSKRIWGLTQSGRSLKTIRQLATAPQAITAFSVDENGNLFVVGYQGMIYQIDFAGSDFNEPSEKFSKRAGGRSGL
jgi:putative heme-binding domain-containing protein